MLTIPSLEDNPTLMAYTVERLAENRGVTRLVFFQKRDYEYDYAQTRMLSELAASYNKLIKQKEAFSYQSISTRLPSRHAALIYNQVHNLVFDTLKKDPATCYVELRRLLRHEQILLDSEGPDNTEAHKLFIK